MQQQAVVSAFPGKQRLPANQTTAPLPPLNTHPTLLAHQHHVGIMSHPWFQAGLPKDALAMNSRFLALPRACPQTEEDIWRVIKTARKLVHSVGHLQESVGLLPSFSPCSKAAA